MKQLYIILTICFGAIACTSTDKKNDRTDTAKTLSAPTNSGPFDLAALTLKEQDAPGMMAATNVKFEPLSDDEPTLSSYEIFKSSNPKLLRFAGKDLSGTNGVKKNHVLLHYNEHTNAMAFYEVELYTQKQANILLTNFKKQASPYLKGLALVKENLK